MINIGDYFVQDGKTLNKHTEVIKHGSHDQKTHAGGKGGGGSASSGGSSSNDGSYGDKEIKNGVITKKDGSALNTKTGAFRVREKDFMSGKDSVRIGKAPIKAEGGIDWAKAGKEMDEKDFFAVYGMAKGTPFAELASDRRPRD